MNVSCFVDGFNLYHSIVAAADDSYGTFKWLDVKSLCFSSKQVFAGSAQLHEVHYFSAYAYHTEKKSPGSVSRHKNWVKCIADTGVITHIGSFNEKSITCLKCNSPITLHEEKKTDVSIAVHVLECLHHDTDTAVIISGDTDLLPTVAVASRLFGHKRVLFAFPYMRKNKVLASACPGSFNLKPEWYKRNQLPDPYILKDGTLVQKPLHW